MAVFRYIKVYNWTNYITSSRTHIIKPFPSTVKHIANQYCEREATWQPFHKYNGAFCLNTTVAVYMQFLIIPSLVFVIRTVNVLPKFP